jgi:hypothetical protein
MTTPIYVAISSHGFGHAAQTCVVLNALAESRIGLKFNISTGVPRDFLTQRLRCDFEYYPEVVDPGLVMKSSLKVLQQESFDSYTSWFSRWDTHIEHLATQMKQHRAALALTNIAFAVAPAAKRVGIPALGFCSLNWADVFSHYCGHFDGASQLVNQIQTAYANLDRFIRLTPAMPMSWMRNSITVPPIVRLGIDQRKRLNDALGVHQDRIRIVLVGFGGIDTPLPLKHWPTAQDVTWIIPAGEKRVREDILSLGDLQLSYIDVLTSCDVVVTKAGYGTFVEAAFAAKPVVYVERDDWPEEPYLVEGLAKYVPIQSVGKSAFYSGQFLNEVNAVSAAAPKYSRPENGIQQVVDEITNFL